MFAVDESVLEHVVSGFHIPPKPEILEQIQALMRDEDVSPTAIGECVSRDVGLSAAVLKTLNSPFYGMARTITDVRQATMLLGINSISTLVASYEIKKAMSGDACISLERFWDNANEVANVMVFIGKRCNPNIPLENLHAAGLFHDCGLPAMAMRFPDYVDTLREANEHEEKSLIELEEERYSCNHAVIGYYIASSWGLPEDLCELILQHHAIDALKHTGSHEFIWMYSTLKASDNMVEQVRRFKQAADWRHVGDDVLRAMGITSLDYSDIEEDYCELVGGE